MEALDPREITTPIAEATATEVGTGTRAVTVISRTGETTAGTGTGTVMVDDVTGAEIVAADGTMIATGTTDVADGTIVAFK
jgi:hypothetical protein